MSCRVLVVRAWLAFSVYEYEYAPGATPLVYSDVRKLESNQTLPTKEELYGRQFGMTIVKIKPDVNPEQLLIVKAQARPCLCEYHILSIQRSNGVRTRTPPTELWHLWKYRPIRYYTLGLPPLSYQVQSTKRHRRATKCTKKNTSKLAPTPSKKQETKKMGRKLLQE